jgi:hypothetical protein
VTVPVASTLATFCTAPVPPIDAMYLSITCAGVTFEGTGSGGGRLATKSSPSAGGSGLFVTFGTPIGMLRPWWQVKHVTLAWPRNVFLLTVLTISIICRAIVFCGLVSSSRLFPSLSWQYGQPTPSAASNNTIVGFSMSARCR